MRAKPSDASKLPAKLGVAELATREPIRARKPMPAEVRELLHPDTGLYVRADHRSKLTLAETRMDKHWSRIAVRGGESPLLRGVPGASQFFEPRPSAAAAIRVHLTKPHRPAWLNLEYMPKLVPFKRSRLQGGIPGRTWSR